MNTAGEAIISTDANSVITSWNRAAETIYGWRREEAIGKPATSIFPEPRYQHGRAREDILREFLEKGRREIEVSYKRKDGSKVDMWTSSVLLKDADGRITGTLSIHTDITERKKAEAELAYLASFPELNPNPILELDRKGNVTYMNPTARELFPDLEAIGCYLTGLIPLVEDESISIPTRDVQVGESWYAQTFSRVPAIHALRIYGRDITWSKKAEQLKDEFIGMVSHELRTPLTVIIGDLHTLSIKGLPKSDAQKLLQDAITSADALASIVENLLELSRFQSGRTGLLKEVTAIGGIALGVIKQLQDKSATHCIKVDFPEGLPAVPVDRIRTERIIFNLIENAIKYSPAGASGSSQNRVRVHPSFLLFR